MEGTLMTNDEKLKILEDFFRFSRNFKVAKVLPVNFEPHAYAIGQPLIDFCKARNTVPSVKEITEAEKEGIMCNVKGCKLPYTEHTFNVVAFLEPIRTMTNADASTELQRMAKHVGPGFIDGVTFLETTEKYRILPLGEEVSTPLK